MDKKTDLTLLVVAMIATFNCLVRSDYNLVIALVCYFFWLSRNDKEERVAAVVRIFKLKRVISHFELTKLSILDY
jgi:hypothetical protein